MVVVQLGEEVGPELPLQARGADGGPARARLARERDYGRGAAGLRALQLSVIKYIIL